jgi:hypothetical protein
VEPASRGFSGGSAGSGCDAPAALARTLSQSAELPVSRIGKPIQGRQTERPDGQAALSRTAHPSSKQVSQACPVTSYGVTDVSLVSYTAGMNHALTSVQWRYVHRSFGRRPPCSTCVVASTEFDVRPGPKIKLAIDGIGCVRPDIGGRNLGYRPAIKTRIEWPTRSCLRRGTAKAEDRPTGTGDRICGENRTASAKHCPKKCRTLRV